MNARACCQARHHVDCVVRRGRFKDSCLGDTAIDAESGSAELAGAGTDEERDGVGDVFWSTEPADGVGRVVADDVGLDRVPVAVIAADVCALQEHGLQPAGPGSPLG